MGWFLVCTTNIEPISQPKKTEAYLDPRPNTLAENDSVNITLSYNVLTSDLLAGLNIYLEVFIGSLFYY